MSQTASSDSIAVRVPTTPGVWGDVPIGRCNNGIAHSLGPGTFSPGALPPISWDGWMSTEQTA